MEWMGGVHVTCVALLEEPCCVFTRKLFRVIGSFTLSTFSQVCEGEVHQAVTCDPRNLPLRQSYASTLLRAERNKATDAMARFVFELEGLQTHLGERGHAPTSCKKSHKSKAARSKRQICTAFGERRANIHRIRREERKKLDCVIDVRHESVFLREESDRRGGERFFLCTSGCPYIPPPAYVISSHLGLRHLRILKYELSAVASPQLQKQQLAQSSR